MSEDKDASKDAGAKLLEPFVVKDPNAFAVNLARAIEAAGKAASAWLAPREGGTKDDNLAEPMVEIAKTMSTVTEYWLTDPRRTLEAQTLLFSQFMQVWSNSLQKMSGEKVEDIVVPAKGDKRFNDEDWTKNSFFDFLKQTYLLTSNWAVDLVAKTEGLDAHTRQKADFYVKIMSNAFSPTNFVLTNPELYKQMIASNGENLVTGMTMMAQDIAAGHGDLKIRQVDETAFSIGENIATTPGKVIARSDIAEIIQYSPTTDEVLKRPLLICPPWINKYYVLDLNEEKSFIKWAVDQGQTVFVISWVNPEKQHALKNWDNYIREGLQFALDAIETSTGEREVNALGYCVGGTLLSAALALFAREGETRIASATLLTTQVDFTHAGDLMVFVDENQISAVEKAMHTTGYLEGTKMATAFNMLRSNELIWSYVVNNYLKGKQPSAFDLLYWNADATRMTAANHSFYLRKCYLENALTTERMVLGGSPVHMKDVTIPVFSVATREDHIAPAKSVFQGCRFFGAQVNFVLAGSGHIAGVVNPPAKNKYQYWTGGAPEGDLQTWLESATETPGSWWPYWLGWIREQDGSKVKARVPGGGKLEPLCDAPGTYVKVRI
ncbi:MAG: class I poly(R)-hydroxyalkanoic acid synthase [Rhizobiaceae bacterium]